MGTVWVMFVFLNLFPMSKHAVHMLGGIKRENGGECMVFLCAIKKEVFVSQLGAGFLLLVVVT